MTQQRKSAVGLVITRGVCLSDFISEHKPTNVQNCIYPSLSGKPQPVRLTTSQIKCCPGPRRPQFLYQSTHRHPFITRRVFPEWSHKYLYGKTSNLCTSRVNRTSAIILLAVGLPACTSLTRELWVRVLLTLTLRPHGRLPTQRNLPVQNFILA